MRGGSWWESTTPASPTDGYASARFYGHLPPPDVTARWDVTAIKPGPKCSLFAPESSPQVPSARLGCRPADLGVYTAVTACYSPGGATSVYNLKGRAHAPVRSSEVSSLWSSALARAVARNLTPLARPIPCSLDAHIHRVSRKIVNEAASSLLSSLP